MSASDKRIDLMIIGAQKAGTTSLKDLLSTIPNIRTHQSIEIPYFLAQSELSAGWVEGWKRYFDSGAGDIVVGKSAGLMYERDALTHLRDHNPKVQIAALLRDPVDRAYSAYWFARRKGWEDIRDFEVAMHAPVDRFGDNEVRKRNCQYLDRGYYAKHLKQVLELFPREQVTVYAFEKFKRDQRCVLAGLLDVVGVCSSVARVADGVKANVAAMPRFPLLTRAMALRIPPGVQALVPRSTLRGLKRTVTRWNEVPARNPPMRESTRKWLTEFYAEKNAELRTLLDIDLSVWRCQQ